MSLFVKLSKSTIPKNIDQYGLETPVARLPIVAGTGAESILMSTGCTIILFDSECIEVSSSKKI